MEIAKVEVMARAIDIESEWFLMKVLVIEDKIFHDTIIRIYRRIRTGECDKCSCVVDKLEKKWGE